MILQRFFVRNKLTNSNILDAERFFIDLLPGALCLRKLSHSHRAIACRPLRGFKHQGCVINSPGEAPAGSAAPGIEEKNDKGATASGF
ncbi:hypothetical protein FH5T_20465 [Draconibacterium orientale]|uniref:Uncharacterized protein n=1 Tax=Draconibacterium orientale TaxID=1168034 RepID=A0ABM5QFR0_9BACT|nr:hypothetical protein FH5T_20465 [Draconibacterium orientale]